MKGETPMKYALQGIAILLFSILVFLFIQEFNGNGIMLLVPMLLGIFGIARVFWEDKSPKE